MKLEGLSVEVILILNVGGFGKVKVAKNKKNGKYVALKLLKKG
jgi:serine/threonine protein kinase